MIISASRRTDIPAQYADWFFNRLRAGYVLVRNPMNPRQVGRVLLSTDTVDGFVFWTKNPAPMLERLGGLAPYPYYFQYTLNAYGKETEPGLPDADEVLIPAFRELSRIAGRSAVVWRYDPVFFTERYTPEYHISRFRYLADRLSRHTNLCSVSFINLYRKTVRNTAKIGLRDPSIEERAVLLAEMQRTAADAGMRLEVCAEPKLLEATGAASGRCIDPVRLAQIAGTEIRVPPDPSRRAGCACAKSIDIGAYDTCPHGCLYCYANVSPDRAAKNAGPHDPEGELLFGSIGPLDNVKERAMPLFRRER